MAIHALVDFPFYVPVCLLAFGGLLGVADRLLTTESQLKPRWSTQGARFAAIGMSALLIVLLIPPALAEAAAGYGNRKWRLGEAQSAAFGFELARRLQPRDWRYHWYAGQFWAAQAAASGNPAAPRLADKALAAGFDANPREPRNLLARTAIHLRFAALLDHPADPSTLRGWADRARALAPLNPGVQREYDALLKQIREIRQRSP
jgi:hypothetical protein